MKKRIITLLFIAALSNTVLAGNDNENDAIMATIASETDAFLQRDYQQWAKHWMHTPYIYLSVSTPDHHLSLHGWHDYSEFMQGLFKIEPDKLGPAAERTDVQIVYSGNLAFVTFKEGGNESVRVLEKHKGKWKLVHTGVSLTNEYKELDKYMTSWSEHQRIENKRETTNQKK